MSIVLTCLGDFDETRLFSRTDLVAICRSKLSTANNLPPRISVNCKELGVVVQDIAVVVGGLGLRVSFRAGKIVHSVANRWPPLQRFFAAVLLRR